MAHTKDTLSPPTPDPGLEPLEAASEWAAFLQSGLATESDKAQFKDWLDRSEAHQTAMRRVMQSWEDVGLAAMSLELSAPIQTALHNEQSPQVSRRWFVPSAIAAALAVAATGALWSAQLMLPKTTEFATNIGEIRTVTLEDGSAVTLGGATQLASTFTSTGRDLEFHQGRAYFNVAEDTTRPFTITAAGTTVTVVGTAFDLEYGPADIVVSVEHGLVDVRADASSTHTEAIRLGADSRVRVPIGGSASEVSEFDRSTLSWKEGQLAYVDARLEDVVAEVNRYRSKKVLLVDPELEDVRVSLRVPTDGTDLLISGLEASLPIEVNPMGPSIRIGLQDED